MDFYFQAANILDRLDSKQGSIKGVLASLPESGRARTAALVIETLKYKAALTDVINASRILLEERKIKSLNLNLTLVLVHDLLLSRGIQAGDGPIKQAILRHKTRLRSELQRIKIKRGVKSDQELANNGDERAARIPRYARINTCLWTTEEAIRHYQEEGFKLGDPFSSDKAFARDEHILDLLVFHPQCQFHDDICYTTGKVILQDKASCFPATVLAPPAKDDTVVIDATAAPGNKTSHLSALMANKGKLYAFERDQKRYRTLKAMLSKAGCKNVDAVNVDFLTVNPTDPKYNRVTHILLDPSCSGSGIVNRLDHLLEAEDDDTEGLENRLNKLASFQLMMIKHAMKFPAVQKIAYSTCSIHAIENEQVVNQALNSEEAVQAGFKLAPRAQTLPTWHRRGKREDMDCQDNAESLIRCSPGEDATNGFFVSCFVKTQITQCTEEVKTIKRKPGNTAPDSKQRKKRRKDRSTGN
ncbi:S-adenosyl-L-methionine-dependent methyltransferase [Pisolithus orientalis]|uniref:S-adenosyl-L-methionine-dependent methyltransferase n=1 Tax=Pisolithus orientalis TaxID=936130 RepID=UPI0022240A2E|nr:S-adenosyl-L-methionine-dependent methyltransferase [Pisolithus orientalis]KAI6025592.1 S-adenosyl-L-methionine-dependent methyltransferase [Pisolithus orientalis]